jgi:hypothetical protein
MLLGYLQRGDERGSSNKWNWDVACINFELLAQSEHSFFYDDVSSGPVGRSEINVSSKSKRVVIG